MLREADRINEEIQAQMDQVRIKYEDRTAKVVGMQTTFECRLQARGYLDSDGIYIFGIGLENLWKPR